VVATTMTDEEWRVRAQAARALAEIGRRRLAVPLLERGLADNAWWVRANCGAGLRRLGPSGLAALRRALRSDDRFARDRAREALDMEAAQRAAA
jgi:HEAT repeat protein